MGGEKKKKGNFYYKIWISFFKKSCFWRSASPHITLHDVCSVVCVCVYFVCVCVCLLQRSYLRFTELVWTKKGGEDFFRKIGWTKTFLTKKRGEDFFSKKIRGGDFFEKIGWWRLFSLTKKIQDLIFQKKAIFEDQKVIDFKKGGEDFQANFS